MVIHLSQRFRRVLCFFIVFFALFQLFVAFPWVETSTGPGGFMICVFINIRGTPEGSTESGFMGEPESNLRPLVYKA